MKILFVVREIEYINPMGAQLMSALAKSGGRTHRTFLHALTDGDILDVLKTIRPDVVAYCSTKTGEHRFFITEVERIHKFEPRIFQIMGGPHTTYFPQEVVRTNLNAICVGEGEHAWTEFLDAYEANRSIDDIPNLVTKNNYASYLKKQSCSTGDSHDPAPIAIDVKQVVRPRNLDLDDLPFLDWDLVLKNTRLGAFPMRSYMVARGCPFRCSYCFEHQDNDMYKGKGPILRRMSVRRVCDELALLKRAYPNTQRIKEYSDVFPVFPKTDDAWLEEWAEVYPKRVGLPFHTLVRSDLIARDPRKAHLLKKSGLDSVTMSIEVGNEEVRNDHRLLDRSMTNAHMEKAFTIFRDLDIPVFANCIFGMPIPKDMMERDGKTALDYDIETFDLCIALKPTYVETGVFHPLPGTNLARFAIEHGAFDGDFDRLHNNYSFLSPLTCFSDKDKWRQLRLCFLTTVVVLFPNQPRLTKWLRHVFVEHLSHWPTTKLCYWMYYLAKVYLIKVHIYPMRIRFVDVFKNLWFSARLEWFKRMTYSGDTKATEHSIPTR